MVQPTQGAVVPRSAIAEFNVQNGTLHPQNTEACNQVEVSMEEIIPDFVLQEILSKIFMNYSLDASLRDLQQSRVVCKRWNRAVTQVFAQNSIIAVPILDQLFKKLVSQTRTPSITNLPFHIRACPLIRDMYDSTERETSLSSGLLRSLEMDSTKTHERSQMVASSLMSSPLFNRTAAAAGRFEFFIDKSMLAIFSEEAVVYLYKMFWIFWDHGTFHVRVF